MTILLSQFFILLLACQANSDEFDDLVLANNDFAFKLYNNLVQEGYKNIIFSPLSISLGLAMTSLGAGNQTLKEIHSAIVGDFPKKQIHEQFHQIMEVIRRNDKIAQVTISNKLFAQKGFEILSSFLDSSQKFYGSEFQTVDFSKINESAFLINNWVSNKTTNIITNIVRPKDLNSLTSLVLVNILCFKAHWATAFKKNLTKYQTFYVNSEKSIQTVFLNGPSTTVFHGTHKTLHFEVIEKDLKSGEFRFGIILPDKELTSLDQVEKNLSATKFSSLGLVSVIANITIPSFKMKASFDLSGNLNKLGIYDLFSKGKTDLSGIENSKSLHVSKALHQVVFGIDEKGTEDNAATFVSPTKSYIENSVRVVFRADHPFLFYIKHVGTGSIIYLGKLSHS